jgi:predicted dehydrogenase
LFASATLLPILKNIPGVELVGIASAAGVHARHAAQKFGFAYAASGEQEIFADDSINTIAILTRHHLHPDLAAKALLSGRHVFVEKPLAIDEAGLLKVITALQGEDGEKGAIPGLLLVGFNRRFAPLAIELAGFLSGRQEPLFMHFRVNAGFIPLHHWTQDPAVGGGRIIGEGCHYVDFLSFLAGAAPLTVTAHALPDAGKYSRDNVTMTFTFPDGSLGVVDYLANGDKALAKEKLEVFCAGRAAVLDDFRTLEMIKDGHRKRLKRAQDKGWRGEWQAFSRAIVTGGTPPIPYDQLIRVTRATFAVVESLKCGSLIAIPH